MVKLTVFLVRCGETEVEAFDADDNNNDNKNGVQAVASPPDEDGGENDAIVEVQDSDDDSNASDNEDNSKTKEDDVESRHSSHSRTAAEAATITKSNGTDPSATDGGDHASEQSHESVANADTDNNKNHSRIRLCQRVDPSLTLNGFQQAQIALTQLLQGISDSTEQERRMAAIAAPTKACTGTGLMLTCAGLHRYTNLRWQLATVPSLQAPCAVPIIVHNILCAAETEIDKCGGHVPVVDAGLLHCAAEPWNDARQKCPFSHVLKHYKGMTKDFVRTWKEEGNDSQPQQEQQQEQPQEQVAEEKQDPEHEHDPAQEQDPEQAQDPEKEQDPEQKQDPDQAQDPDQGQDPEQEQDPEQASEKELEQAPEQTQTGTHSNRCIDVQYLRVADEADPWSLVDLTMKNNILVDLIDPKRYMTPPRKGQLHKKRVGRIEPPGPEQGVRQAVMWSRQVGCDAVILFVGKAAMQELAKTAGLLESEDELLAPACSLASLVADVPGQAEEEAKLLDIDFEFHGFFTSEELQEDPSRAIPPYTGPVDTIVPPPEGQDPMTVPVNQWSKFPPPEPENIPNDYPDLPPFSKCLEVPLPRRQRPMKQQQQRPAPANGTASVPNAAARPEQAPSTPIKAAG